MSQKLNLKVYGPNMSSEDARHGTFQVHLGTCSDCLRLERRYRDFSDTKATEYDSKAAVVQDVYPPRDFQYDATDEDARDPYVQDIWFAPCVPKEFPNGWDEAPGDLGPVIDFLNAAQSGAFDGAPADIDIEKALAILVAAAQENN